jgi:hypothetical protein
LRAEIDALARRMSWRIFAEVPVHTAEAARVAVTDDATSETTVLLTDRTPELVSLRRPFSTGSMLRRAMDSSVTRVSLPDFVTFASAAGPSEMVVSVYSEPGDTASGAASANMPSTCS